MRVLPFVFISILFLNTSKNNPTNPIIEEDNTVRRDKYEKQNYYA